MTGSSPPARGIAENSAFYFAMQVVSFILGVAVSVVVTRALGPSLRGEYFIIQTSSSLLVGLSSLGIAATNRYWLSKSKYLPAEVNTNSLLLSLFLGVLTMIIYFLFRDFLHATILKGVRSRFMLVGIFLIPFGLYSMAWSAIMAGMSRFPTLSIFTMATSLLNGILTLVIVLGLKARLQGLLSLWVVMTVLNLFIMLYLVENGFRVRFIFRPRLIWEAISFGSRDHLGSLAYHLMTNMDGYIVNSFLGLRETGLYSLAKALSGRVALLPNSLVQAAIPRIGGANEEEALTLTSKVVRHSLLLSVAACTLLVAFAPWGVPLLYGKEFLHSIVPLAWMAPGVVFLTLAVVLSSYTTFQRGKPEIPAVLTWIALAVSVPLCILLTKHGGINGSSLAVSITYCLLMILLSLPILVRHRKFIKDSVSISRDDFSEYRRFLASKLTRPATRPV